MSCASPILIKAKKEEWIKEIQSIFWGHINAALHSALTGHLNLPSLFSRAFELRLHLYNCFCVRVSKTFKPEQLLQTVKQLCWNVGVLTFPLKHPEELAYMLENDMQPILKRTWTLIIYTVIFKTITPPPPPPPMLKIPQSWRLKHLWWVCQSIYLFFYWVRLWKSYDEP